MRSLRLECLAGWEGWFAPASVAMKIGGGKPPFLTYNFVRALLLLPALLSTNIVFAQGQTAAPPISRTLTVTSEPNAIIWIDEIRRGVTDASGTATIKGISRARHTLRVRANGFKETTVPILPGKTSALVKLVRTTDAAELAFQEAETAREQAKTDEARRRSVEAYRRALMLRPSFPAARVGLARVLLDLNEYKEALAEIGAARRSRPIYPEASAVEGRIHREAAFDEEAIKSFRRAIREARGFQPEAHVGLARVLEEKGQSPTPLVAGLPLLNA